MIGTENFHMLIFEDGKIKSPNKHTINGGNEISHNKNKILGKQIERDHKVEEDEQGPASKRFKTDSLNFER